MASLSTTSISVLVAEDKDVLRTGLVQLISGIDGFKVIAETIDGQTTVEKTLELSPHLIVVKLDLPGQLDGVQTVNQIKRVRPDAKILLSLNRAEDFWRALEARADGYFMREMPLYTIETAMRSVASGSAFIGTLVCEYLLKGEGFQILRSATASRRDLTPLEILSTREKDVMQLLVEGHSNEEIAQNLNLSVQTVKVHVKHILKKLKVGDRTQAVIKVLRMGY